MLFVVLYRWRPGVNDEETRRIRDLFVAWDPPAGLEINAHYHFARGGGLAILEASGAGTLFEALAPFSPSLDFDIEPIVNVLEAVAISLDVDEWVESVGDTGPGQESSLG